MIPKLIHYCWFGGKKKSYLTELYINSWKRCMPDYQIIEWNEKNSPIMTNNFAKEA